MNKIKDGGPAFPCEESVARAFAVFEGATRPLTDGQYVELIDKLRTGMPLRDYFAAKALQGLLSNTDPGVYRTADFAETAYLYADEMLKAREK